MIATARLGTHVPFSTANRLAGLDRPLAPSDIARAIEAAVRPLPVPAEPECPFADWADGDTGEAAVAAAFPDPFDVAWFRRNVKLSPTAARRVRDAVKRRRRADASFLPWWPSDASFEAANAFWFVARAAVDPADFAHLWSVCDGECKADPFEAIWRARHDHELRGDRYDARGFLFAFVLARGAEALIAQFGNYMQGGREHSKEVMALLDWYVRRHPECYEMIDARTPKPVAADPAGDVAVDAAPAGVPDTAPAETNDLSVAEALLAASESERVALEAERDVLWDDLNDLNMRYAALQRELAAVRAGHDPRKLAVAPKSEELPTTLPELLEWIETSLPPTVHVTPRAWRGIKKAVSVDFERVAKGLRFLRDVYVPYRTDQGVTAEQYAAAQVEAGFDECACFASTSSLAAFPEYTIAWNGGTIDLERHLKRGYSNNPRDMLRIYFAWCKATKTVVVGSMPGHLDNWRC